MTDAAIRDRRSVWSWIIYDLANTVFALGVIGLYFPDWLTSVDQPDSLLAIVEATAGLIVIFLAPWAGARSDAKGTRVPTLIATTLVAVTATALLGINVPLSIVALGVALIAFNIGAVVYDALLVDVSTEGDRGRISGLGIGIGYVGSYLGLLVGILTLDILAWSYSATFRSLAFVFLVFAIPSFVFIKEREGSAGARAPGIIDIPRRLGVAWRTASRYPGVVRFLVSRFLYTDAINTLIGGFLTIFVIQELGLDRQFVQGLLGLAITAAIFGGIGTGRVVERHGPTRVLRWVLVIWMLAISFGILAALTGRTWLAWAIGPLGGFALGATWASDRVVMTRISPPRFLGEFYGLYATVGRFATILGPLVWALVVDVLDLGRRVAMGALIAFVFTGWWLLKRVDDAPRFWASGDLPIVPGAIAPDV
ncbi:MAG: MFS transporter [Acidimicrobiia bacterium]|nr:MFS transporter [Acidimicrobiia bacterium]MDH3462638.1 MFS transporter [Acidimicrobiia bacterium]